MTALSRLGRILLGTLSVLVLVASAGGAAAQAFWSARVTVLDTQGALSEPSAALSPAGKRPTPASAPAGSLSPQRPSQPPVPPPPSVIAAGAPLNILVLGSDTRAGQGTGFGDADQIAGQRADTAMLVHLNGPRDRITVISLPRDLWVPLPACDLPDGTTSRPHNGRFNEAFSLGGAPCAIQAAADLTGQPIHHVAVVDFTGFKNIVDAAGGIQVCLGDPVRDSKARLNLEAGPQTVNGAQALALARARYSLGDGSDLSRIERQQRLARAAVDNLTDQAHRDPLAVYRIADAGLQALAVDPGLAEPGTLLSLLATAVTMDRSQIEYATWPWTYRDGATVAIDTERADAWSAALASDTLPLTEPDSDPPTKKAKKKQAASNAGGCVTPLF